MKKTITQLLPDIKEHIVIRDYTTWKVGGIIDFFYLAQKIEDLVRVTRVAIENKIPYIILGNGSNVLFSDYGFPGLVIKNTASTISILKDKSQIISDSGTQISRLIMDAIANDLTGLEFLYGIPGTIGGAIYGNAGAFGFSIGDYIKNVTLLQIDKKDGIPKVVQYDRSWFEFNYRSSKLKKIRSRFKPVILSARFQLSHNQKSEIMRKVNEYKTKRQSTQPIGLSAGCVFRNPIPSELKNYSGAGTSGMPELPKERRAGYLLENSGAKKLTIGSAQVSDKHANFIINTNGAKASDIRSLIEEMRDKVHQKYDITLEEEIEYIGQW